MGDDLESRLKAEALRLGFSLSGIAPAVEADGFARYQQWLDKGYAGKMDYLHRNAPSRRHPAAILEGVRSVLMLGMEYEGARGQRPGASEQENLTSSLAPGPWPLAHEAGPWPLRKESLLYAAGPDYHNHHLGSDQRHLSGSWLMAEGSRLHGPMA